MYYNLFIIEILSAFILAATLLYRYGDCYRNHILVTVSVLTAWYFSFLIMFILPLDISWTVYRQHQCLNATEPTSVAVQANLSSSVAPPINKCEISWPDNIFPSLWRVVYWSSQCLTWLIMPMMQSYSKAGDFTVKGKLKSALVDNAIYYGSYLFICGILLIYLAFTSGVQLDGPKIKAIASSASNTWGLFLLILLLGYALVEVPRNLWNNSKKNYTLSYCYFKIAKLSTDKCEAEETVDDILESLNMALGAITAGHPLQSHVETIVQKLPVQLKDKLNSRIPPDRPSPPSMKSLINLHKKTIKALHVLQRTETQYGLMLQRIFHLEDVSTNSRSPDKRFQHTFYTPRPRIQRILYSPVLVFNKAVLSEDNGGNHMRDVPDGGLVRGYILQQEARALYIRKRHNIYTEHRLHILLRLFDCAQDPSTEPVLLSTTPPDQRVQSDILRDDGLQTNPGYVSQLSE
ncbi:unnamed protein product [Leptidea sinapis]|uniref:LMBR1 domain-containing protein 2 n=1 Tax=Leptidea sinapis TaxID=189913 RepID=A0A5E4Q458_9NEOP|nr:unnamed protein product [Leptidea sinapis]